MSVLPNQFLPDLMTQLPERYESEHFTLHYALRNPPQGAGHGVHGVRDLSVVAVYAEALEAAFDVMRKSPWLRPPPLTNPVDGRTDVYICDVRESFVTVFRGSHPVILLASRNWEPTCEGERQRAMAEAAHEVMHLFNFSQRPWMPIKGQCEAVWGSELWRWLDEGMAINLEEQVLEDNQDRFRFLMDWIDRPEVSLDARRAIYQTAMFVRYLYHRFGEAFVNQVWIEALAEDTPVSAFNRMSPSGEQFAVAETDQADLFSAYCRDAYFFNDPHSACHEPEAWRRFGARALTESFMLSAGDAAQTGTYELDHLACRYFRFTLAAEVEQLSLRMCVKREHSLKAELVAITSEGYQGNRQRLRITARNNSAKGEVWLAGELAVPADGNREVVLVVSNCGLRQQQENSTVAHDDGQPFRLEVSAD